MLPWNDNVLITCYYWGTDWYEQNWGVWGVEDHTTWDQANGSFTGHIPDHFVDEGGLNPWDDPYDLAHCG